MVELPGFSSSAWRALFYCWLYTRGRRRRRVRVRGVGDVMTCVVTSSAPLKGSAPAGSWQTAGKWRRVDRAVRSFS